MLTRWLLRECAAPMSLAMAGFVGAIGIMVCVSLTLEGLYYRRVPEALGCFVILSAATYAIGNLVARVVSRAAGGTTDEAPWEGAHPLFSFRIRRYLQSLKQQSLSPDEVQARYKTCVRNQSRALYCALALTL